MTRIIVKKIKGTKLVSKNKRYLKKFNKIPLDKIVYYIGGKEKLGWIQVKVILKRSKKKILVDNPAEKMATFKGEDFDLIELIEHKKAYKIDYPINLEFLLETNEPEETKEEPKKLSLFERIKRFIGLK